MRVILCFIVIVLSLQSPVSPRKSKDSDVEYRVEGLKRALVKQIRQKHKTAAKVTTSDDDVIENYVYIDESERPITPIMDFDKRKLTQSFRLKEFITTKSDWVPELASSSVEKQALRNEAKPTKIGSEVSQAREIFYRRQTQYKGFVINKEEMQYVHCVVLVTPLLKGNTHEQQYKTVMANDNIVLRLMHLLSINTTDYESEDIRAILYQISNIPIRLFQWDVLAMRRIFNVVIKEKAHNFRTLKRGIRDLFAMWHLDLSNLSMLYKQARVFRPPCVQISRFEGSTKTSKSIRYTKSKSKRSTSCSSTTRH